MKVNREDEIRGLLQAACKPAVASPEFREWLLRRLTQQVSRQARPQTTYAVAAKAALFAPTEGRGTTRSCTWV